MDWKRNSLCRVCLGGATKKDKSLFHYHMNLPICSHILSIANVNIMENDGFPDKICSQCLEGLITVIRFKNKCEETDAILQTTTFPHVQEAAEDENETSEIGNKEKVKEEPEEGNNMSTSDDIGGDSQTFDGVDKSPDQIIGIKSEDVKKEDSQTLDSTLMIDHTTDLDNSYDKMDIEASCQDSQCKTPNDQVILKCEEAEEDDQNNTQIIDDTMGNSTDDDEDKTHIENLTEKHVFKSTSQIIDDTARNYIDDDDDETLTKEHELKPVFKSKAIDLHLQCDDCKDFFKSKCKLSVHWKKVHKQSQLICQSCKRDFKTNSALQKHKKNRPKTCKEASNFRIEGVGRSRIIYCKLCSYKSNTMECLINHKVTHTGEKPFTCEKCGKSHTQLSGLTAHKQFAHGEYKVEIICQYCGKVVKGHGKAYLHLKFHKNQCIQCEICKKLLKNKRCHKNHMLRHKGMKNEQCEICDKRFYTKAEKINHNRLRHPRSEKKIHECDLCSYKTTVEKTMIKHRLMHSAYNFSCTQCGRFFVTTKKLDIHKKRHTEKNYSCQYCDLKFHRNYKLKIHVKKRHQPSENNDEQQKASLHKDPTLRSKKKKI